jgi:hypothetical protein
MLTFTGGCACGAVRYELAEEPILQLICHCTDCQKASGSEFSKVLFVAADRLSMLGREPKFYSVKANSGRTMNRGFCDTCGSPVMIRRPEIPQIEFLQAGSLDDPNIFRAAAEVFTCRAHSVVTSIEGKDRFEEGPPVDLVGDVIKAHFARRRPLSP